MESGFAQTLWIALLGMGVTFCALALVMGTMILLTRLVRDARLPGEQAGQGTTDTRAPVDDAPGELTLAEPLPGGPAPIDLELPAGVEMAEVLAAVVAVAAARELALQRRSARVWMSAQPRALISPWQLVARGLQMGRSRR